MLLSEFIKLTGYNPTSEEFVTIVLNYNLSTEDKFTWCANWCKQNPDKAGLLERQAKKDNYISAQKETTLNRVIRFVYRFNASAKVDDITFQKVIKNLDGKIARSEIKRIKDYKGITQNWNVNEWTNYWKLFNLVCYGF